MLLEMSDEETAMLERLFEATAHVRAAGGSPEQKHEAIERVLAGDPGLREAFRRLTGFDSPRLSGA